MSEQDIATENVISVKEETNALMPQDVIDMMYEYEEWKAKMKVLEEQKKNALLEVMNKYSITEIDNEKWNAKLVTPKDKVVVDTQKLKDEGLYELYTKTTSVKPYVKITLKYE